MENGGLTEKFDGLTMNDAKDSSLFQVMKAVEAAEATIKQQVEENNRLRTEHEHIVEENNRLRTELQKKDKQPEQIKVDRATTQRYQPVELYDDQGGRGLSSLKHAATDSQNMFPHNVLMQKPEGPAKQSHAEKNSSTIRNNGSLNALHHGQRNPESSSLSFSPRRYTMDREYESHMNDPGQGMMYVPESNKSGNFWKQEALQKIREQDQEIMLLKKHLSEYSIREAQIRNEKDVLEKRIAQMRMAFDQQQQDLVDASSKALSYRQDIIEENVRLTYALQDAQQERTTFVSTMMPLLAEYSFQPQVPDAQSIISNVKVLFKHLQEKLIITEAKLKESQYQLTPWRPDGNNSSLPPPSPQNFSGAALASSENGLEIVRSSELDDMGRYSHIASR